MVARTMVLQSPLEKALTNTMECLTTKEEKEVQSYLEELERERERERGVKIIFFTLNNVFIICRSRLANYLLYVELHLVCLSR